MVKLKNKFVVVVPVYNQPERIRKCIESIYSQTYHDVGIIVRDDCSTDDTFESAKQTVKELMHGKPLKRTTESGDVLIGQYENLHDRSTRTVLLVRNEKKLWPSGNIYESVMENVSLDFPNAGCVVGTVDGDDYLSDTTAIETIMKEYENGWWLVWTQHQNQNGVGGCSQPLPPDDVIYAHRHYWSVSHFRTAKAMLYRRLDKESLKDFFEPGKYMKMCGDAAILYQLIEMAGNARCKFIDKVMYTYNDSTGLNEHSPSTVGMQHRYSALIKHLPKRQKLETLP